MVVCQGNKEKKSLVFESVVDATSSGRKLRDENRLEPERSNVQPAEGLERRHVVEFDGAFKTDEPSPTSARESGTSALNGSSILQEGSARGLKKSSESGWTGVGGE